MVWKKAGKLGEGGGRGGRKKKKASNYRVVRMLWCLYLSGYPGTGTSRTGGWKGRSVDPVHALDGALDGNLVDHPPARLWRWCLYWRMPILYFSSWLNVKLAKKKSNAIIGRQRQEETHRIPIPTIPHDPNVPVKCKIVSLQHGHGQ